VKEGTKQKQIGGQDLLCPKHYTKLPFALKGGAGYCPRCGFYVQAAGVPAPSVDRPTEKVKARSKSGKRTARAESR
jgi:hypothetical protein